MGTVELIRLKIMVVPYTLRKSALCPLPLKRKKGNVFIYIRRMARSLWKRHFDGLVQTIVTTLMFICCYNSAPLSPQFDKKQTNNLMFTVTTHSRFSKMSTL